LNGDGEAGKVHGTGTALSAAHFSSVFRLGN